MRLLVYHFFGTRCIYARRRKKSRKQL